MMEEDKRRRGRKQRVGQVLSTNMAKTAVVKVERRFRHAVFKKVVKSYGKLYVHDEGQIARPGDFVTVEETRPISKTKCWRLVAVVQPAASAGTSMN